MASHKSAKKCIRQTITRTAINKSRMSRIRTFVKKALESLNAQKDGSSIENAKAAVVAAERELMRGVRKGTMHRNTASRTVSRLAQKIRQSS